MPQINADLDNAPDQIVPVAPGVYDLEVLEAPELTETNDGKGQKLVVSFRILTDGPEQGRQLFDHISLKMTTRLKRLARAAGINPGDFAENTDILEGQTVKVLVSSRTYKDKETGEMREASNIKDYFVGDETDPKV